MASTHLRSSGRSVFIRMLALLAGIVPAIVIAESAAYYYFTRSNPQYETVRQQLAGFQVSTNQKVTGQPYLLYAPSPNYVSGENYHNAQGYRGEAVPMKRTKGILRILCLGGSTTYGHKVEDPEDSYPAQLREILEAKLPAEFEGIEVINGGLEYGTTAELLTHYHFKFHYFQPDLVIINTGGNDAVASSQAYYQPDYSHFRKSIYPVQPLHGFGRVLVRSRFFAWLIIHTLYGGMQQQNQWIDRPGNIPPATAWHPAAQNPGLTKFVPDSELAFTRNLDTLIREIRGDGAEVLLVPFRLAPGSGYANPAIEAWTTKNERILHALASLRQVPVAPFEAQVISQENWVDHCHLNAAGSQEKASHIAPYVSQLLWPSAP